jgi:hypothetical protein
MLDLVLRCGFIPDESSVGVTFSEGCAQSFSAKRPGPDEAAITACIAAALSGSRFACADQLSCWGVFYTSLAG